MWLWYDATTYALLPSLNIYNPFFSHNNLSQLYVTGVSCTFFNNALFLAHFTITNSLSRYFASISQLYVTELNYLGYLSCKYC